jgi:hypothetical protein
MTFPETLNTEVADNELSFPLVTHMAYSNDGLVAMGF